MKQLKFIISGGGTGGHIYPALAIINKIKEKEPDAEMVEVAIAAVEAVFDWDTFIHEELEEVEV